ncbi:hypothetical protein [Rubinisphaera italica]|uniref:Uncharacterized protein n=1 Tax=Rubinisphaera italica TaxID=2527969 RepID=A0A5C5X9U9_9PLAN|nr:hypothetical protein [Rubinisphaera italica]TWT59740.1 hypothetical protein Pan54_04500 [Rubinisphaera italica]
MKMSFDTIVSPEGANTFVLHSYFSTSTNVDSLIEKIKVAVSVPIEWFDLTEQEGNLRLILVEIAFGTMQEFAQMAATLLQFAKSSAKIEIIVLMFDGAFCGEEQLLGDAIADQIYGIATPFSGPLLCLDREILLSEYWRSLICHLRSVYLENVNAGGTG